jgi:hypothetical protein
MILSRIELFILVLCLDLLLDGQLIFKWALDVFVSFLGLFSVRDDVGVSLAPEMLYLFIYLFIYVFLIFLVDTKCHFWYI